MSARWIPILCLVAAASAASAAAPHDAFIENRGQIDGPAVRFALPVPDGRVWIEPGRVAYELRARDRAAVIYERFTAQGGEPAGVAAAATRINDLRGRDPERWRRDIPTWRSVSLGDVADGVALRVEARAGTVEKIFTVAPGARPAAIAVEVLGATSVAVEPDGTLALRTPVATARFTRPVAFQEIDGRRVEVPVRYATTGSTRYGFSVGAYDATRPLVIDPQLLLASSYAGTLSYDYGMGIAVAANGDVYVAGHSANDTIPARTYPTTPGVYQTVHADDGNKYDVVVSRFSPDLSTLVASTFVGGGGDDRASVLEIVSGLTEGAPERILVAGITSSSDFPTTPGAYDTTPNGSSDVFVLTLSPDLATLTASTLLGGSSAENASESYAAKAVALAVAPDQSIYLAGTTYSYDFPVPPTAFQPNAESKEEVFVARLSPDLGALLAASFLGGDQDDEAFAIAVSPTSVWVAGATESGPDPYYPADAAFPTTSGAFQEEFHPSGGVILPDGFVSRFDAGLTTLEASTFLGDVRQDVIHAMARDPASGVVYVAGSTQSTDFPVTPGALDTDGGLGFVSGLSGDLTTLVASSFFGGTGSVAMRALRVDSAGGVWVTGYTTADDFPVSADALYPAHGYSRDVFLARLDPALATATSATYLPGEGWEEAYDLRVHEGGWSLPAGGQVVAPGDPTVLLTGYSETSSSAETSYPTTPDAYDRIARNDDLFATIVGFPAPEPGAAALAMAAGGALAALARRRVRPGGRACGAR